MVTLGADQHQRAPSGTAFSTAARASDFHF